MKAIFFDGNLKFTKDYPVPEPGQNEALIRVLVAGICNTDLEILKGYLGFKGILGHEFVGIVERTPAGYEDLQGMRVVGDINCGCGICGYCKKGMRKHCPGRTTVGIGGRDGVFAEYVSLPVSNLSAVTETISDEEAVFTEPLAAALEIAEQIQVRPTDEILVLGDGKLGLLCAMTLAFSGAHVTLSGKHEEKLAIARLARVDTVDMNTAVIPADKQYDIVMEATGNPQGLETALKFTRPRGMIVLKSTVADVSSINMAPIVINEITITGSRCGPFDAALRALEQKRIDVRPLISAVYSFEKAHDAFTKAGDRKSLKILIDFR